MVRHPNLPTLYICLLLHTSMSAPSRTSPLSFNRNSDGGFELQDVISSDNPIAQPPVTPLLDGGRPHHNSKSSKPQHPC